MRGAGPLTPEICLRCQRARTQVKKLLKKLHTGDPTLDQIIRAFLYETIPQIIHSYYGIEEKPTTERYVT